MPEVSPYLIIPLVAVIVCQIVKFAVHGFSNEIDFNQLLRRGGLPSARVALVTALAVTSLAVDGLASSIAGLTLILSGLYIWEVLGHNNRRPVAAGIITGALSGALLSIKYWKDDLNWLFDLPTDTEITNGFIIFGFLLVLGEGLAYMTRRKSMRKLPTSRRLNRAFRLSLTLPALIGIGITFAQQQSLGLFDARIWTLLVVLWVILASIYFWWRVYRHAKVHLAEEVAHFKSSKSKSKSRGKKKKPAKKKRK